MRRRKQENLFGLGSAAQKKRMRQTTPASGGIAASLARGKGSRAKLATFKGYSIQRTGDGEYVVPKLDPESRFEDLTQAKRFITSWKSNPAKFERCVKAVKAKGGAGNAYAVCTAAGTRNGRKKRNPPAEAAKAYKEFHGRPSGEEVVQKQSIHYHLHLASLGELRKLEVVSRAGFKVTLEKFQGALLCENEKGNQLYVEGGDQTVNLAEFGIEQAHELEALGEVKVVEYFTTKDHLGNEGGTAIYRHKFDRPYPELQYDTINKQLLFTGGGYVILPEGIDR